MKILILGASGYTGGCIKETLSNSFKDVLGTYRTEKLDYLQDTSMIQYELENKEKLVEILEQYNPDVVISCLRGSFKEQIKVHKIVVQFLKENHGKIVYLSSANVFDGVLQKAHYEEETPKADTEYGAFKIECETLILRELGENAIIIRPPEIWGENCPRLVNILEKRKTNTPIQTYENLYINYSTNVQIAEWIVYILKHNLKGIFHIGTKDICEYREFHEKLIEALQLKGVTYQSERCENKIIQAVLPRRKEIPESMQWAIDDVVQYLRRCFVEV